MAFSAQFQIIDDVFLGRGTNVTENHTLSIFKAEVVKLEMDGFM
jgi:hypothetical protein